MTKSRSICNCCLRYCKSTIFQANHNQVPKPLPLGCVVCDTAKVRFFKQITTHLKRILGLIRCLRYCKSTIFQANHNLIIHLHALVHVVCDTAKVRFFKQITTHLLTAVVLLELFAILQKYDFSSKSQRCRQRWQGATRCLRYCKSTIFQANHNLKRWVGLVIYVVCDTAKVRFFKQITTKILCKIHT